MKRREGRLAGKLARTLLAAALAVGLCPAVSWADDGTAVEGVAQTLASVEPVESRNTGNWQYDYDRYSSPMTSYLHVTPAGSVQRVEYVDGALIVEDYVGTAPDLEISSSHMIAEETYTPSVMAAGNSVIWGGFFAGEDGYYVVTGQNNPDEDDSLPVVRVTKYTTSWEYADCLELSAINTYIPFDAGSLRMAESGGTLYIRTSHEMYASSDGLHHQANMTFLVDEATMELKSRQTSVSNISSSYGYVSHSFNQFLAELDGSMWALDHGDANPRSVVLKRFGTSSYVNVLEIAGTVGANDTGVAVGGFSSSESAGTLLAAYNTIDQSLYSTSADFGYYARNAYVSTYSPDTGDLRTVALTNNADRGSTSAGMPMLVKINENRFLALWENFERTESSTRSASFSPTGTVSYVFLDGEGALASEVRTMNAELSDCQPVLVDHDVVWYVTGTPRSLASYGTTTPTFYSINVETGASAGPNALLFAEVGGIEQSYVYTGSAIEPVPTVTLDGTALVEGVDYEVSYENNRNVGTATVVITGLGSVSGAVEYEFSVTRVSLINVDIAIGSSYEYDGSPVEPDPVLTYNGTTLVEGIDYTVSYESNDGVGTGRVMLSGTGNFSGTVWTSFRIVEPTPDSETTPDSDPDPGITFSDVPADYWGRDWIYNAVSLGLMNGDRDPHTQELTGVFRPEDPITRAEVATILYRYANPDSNLTTDPEAYQQEVNESDLVDNEDGQFYTAALNWAYEAGILTGDDDPVTGEPLYTARPNSPVTRQEVAVMLARCAAWAGLDTTGASDAYRDSPGADAVMPFAEAAMAWCFDKEILTGDAQTGDLMPQGNATRAQLAKMVVSVAQLVG